MTLTFCGLITVTINDTKEELFYRSSPCSGVKLCPLEGCDHTVPIRDKRNCPKHNKVLLRSGDCPVQFVYLFPKDPSDRRR